MIKIDYNSGKISNILDSNETIYEAFGMNDSLNLNKKTLIGSDGFQIIQIEESLEDEFVIYWEYGQWIFTSIRRG